MHIAVLTTGRFHVCDLARELDALGHEVSFYSLVPPSRTARFGLPRRCNRWLLPYVAPFYAAARAAQGTTLASRADVLLIEAVDHMAAKVIRRCDVFIGMSGMCAHTIEAVRRKYGAKVLLERGSRHILSQREILGTMPGEKTTRHAIPEWAVRRETMEYDLADVIVVPSHHVVESFTDRGIPESKLFRNPYGVDLDMFPPTPAPTGAASPQIIMTGAWSRRKGCDVLTDACRKAKAPLTHVGPMGDLPFPVEPSFQHYDAVKQQALTWVYARAHVFALASREEGLALVQAQALASGLPVVCTDRTGGADLREYLEDPNLVTVVPHDNSIALASALEAALAKSRVQTGIRDILGSGRSALSWKAYAQRYDQALRERC